MLLVVFEGSSTRRRGLTCTCSHCYAASHHTDTVQLSCRGGNKHARCFGCDAITSSSWASPAVSMHAPLQRKHSGGRPVSPRQVRSWATPELTFKGTAFYTPTSRTCHLSLVLSDLSIQSRVCRYLSENLNLMAFLSSTNDSLEALSSFTSFTVTT